MPVESRILSVILVPLAGAFALPVAGIISRRLRNLLALIAVAAPFVWLCSMVPAAMNNLSVTLRWPIPLGFNLTFTADPLAVFMALVSSGISAVIVLYSWSYISHYEHQQEYYLMVVLFVGAMMGLVFSSNVITLFIFWEITALTSWRLIGFFRQPQYVLRADKAFMVTVAGALLMLTGFIIIYTQTGSFDFVDIRSAYKVHAVSLAAVVFILAGIFSKSATLPFHTWLPDAGIAPSPVTALLHAAVLVKIGVYVFARLFLDVIPLPQVALQIVLAVCCTSALVSAGAALIETDMKRIIAYSTVSQIAFIFLGFAVGGTMAIAGSLLYILMHGIAKAGLFLCAGIVEQNTKTKDITKLGGLFHAMPVTAVSFLVCAFSVMGIPPFGGFFSKFMVLSATAQQGYGVYAALFLVGACMTVLYLVRLFNALFMGPERLQGIHEKSIGMVSCVALLAALSLIAGIMISYPAQFAVVAAQSMIKVVQ